MEEKRKLTRQEIDLVVDMLETGILNEKKKEEKLGCLAHIGALTIILLNIVVFTVLQGYILTSAWGWFIVPLGVVPIGFWHAYGISMTVKLFSIGWGKIEDSKKIESMEEVWKFIGEFAGKTIGLLLVWLLLYVTHCMI